MIRALVLLLLSMNLVTNARADSLTETEKNRILEAHNQVRAQVAKGQLGKQPSAANMSVLVWDEALERVAQGWADQCVFSHNDERVTEYRTAGGESSSVGGNLFATSVDEKVPTEAVKSWLAEHTRFTFGPVSRKAVPATGHYTQLAWAATRRVGCAQATCPSLVSGARDQLLVCNYAPAGNFISNVPYQSGPTASQCPPDLPEVSNGLCAAPSAVDPQ